MPQRLLTNPLHSDKMRLVWLQTEFYETSRTALARDILGAVVRNGPVQGKLTRRLLDKLQVDPAKVLTVLTLPPDAALLQKIYGAHLIFDSFVCLLHYYALLEIGLELGLVQWPLPQNERKTALQFLGFQKLEEFYIKRYPISLVPKLRNRLDNDIAPAKGARSEEVESAFHGLLALHDNLLRDRALRSFLFYFWFSSLTPKREDRLKLSFRTREERLLGLNDEVTIDCVRPGYMSTISALRTICDLKELSPGSPFPGLVDAFYNPWFDLAAAHADWLEETGHHAINSLKPQLRKDLKPEELKKAEEAFGLCHAYFNKEFSKLLPKGPPPAQAAAAPPVKPSPRPIEPAASPAKIKAVKPKREPPEALSH